MRILVAPDKFKDSLGALEVADNIAAGLHEILPAATIEVMPVADGGEGTADAICRARNGEWAICAAHDALDRAIEGRYVCLPDPAMAVIEMSEAAGLWRIGPSERAPLRANTYGVGEMLLEAMRRDAKEIFVCLGGSATNDGGFGMARALGFRFLDDNGADLTGPVSDLRRLDRVLSPKDLVLPHVTAVADVRNPLLGPRGATRIFGPQKGATAEQLEILEEALARLAEVVADDLGSEFCEEPGAGAAGGLGFGLMSFCGASVRPGFEVVAEFINLKAAIERADLVITGEGSLDEQTLEGKAPVGVARIAREARKRVFAIVGTEQAVPAMRGLFDTVVRLARAPMTVEESIAHTGELLRERARELARTL